MSLFPSLRALAVAAVFCLPSAAGAQTPSANTDAEARFNSGLTHLRDGRPKLALEEFQRAIKQDPKNPYFHKGLGLAYATLKRFEDAADAFRKALELNPYYTDVRNDLGMALVLAGKRQEGKAEFLAAFNDPTNPTPEISSRNLGQAYFEEKNYAEAANWFRSSLNRNKEYPDAYLGLADALVALGLSDREAEVALMVVEGRTHKEIGAQLFISPKTVEHHVAKIRQKLGATSRAELVATIRRDGAQWEMRFKQGKPVGPLKKLGPARGTGTTVYFHPDAAIFPKIEFDPAVIRERLEVASYVHKGLKVVFEDETSKTKETFEHPEGLVDYLKAIVVARGAKSVHEAWEVQTDFEKSALDSYIAQATKINDLWMDAAKQAVAPMTARFSALSEAVQEVRPVYPFARAAAE